MNAQKNDKKKPILYTKIIGFVINLVSVILVIIGLLIAVTLIPINGNYKIMSVMSGSMAPSIPVGSLIVIKPSQDYQVGDVISFSPSDPKSKKDNVTHRIYSIVTKNDIKLFETKGDANENPDIGFVTSERIIGKQLFSIALLGYILSYVKTLPGLILIILLPSIIIIFDEIRKIRSESKLLAQKKKNNTKIKD